MRQFKLQFDYEKEEVFLNEMSAEGYAMTHFNSGVYDFIPCEPCQYIYRIAYLGGLSDEAVSDLVREQFLKGAELVQRMSLWAYFRSTEPFEIYDTEGRLDVASRIQKLYTIGGLVAAAVSVFFTTLSAVTKRKSWMIAAIPSAVLAGCYAFISYLYLQKQQKAFDEIMGEVDETAAASIEAE